MRALLLLVVLMALAGAGAWALTSGDSPRAAESERTPSTRSAPSETPVATRRRARRVRASRCPSGLAGCRSVRGRVLFVESVDPDGDGDLHVVVAAGGITAPGLTSVDVKPSLRPARDPRIGDEVSAAGQVQRGSVGQSQVHAVEFRVRAATR